ncbi:LysR substrate-binding domain-containing protein [Actinomadura rudentiformis]|uniref:LysR substrate-binding domain-containing protein n=1 Tax=Actinomadura rudentiformis TaxID=359158 RepID=UPI001CEF855E|nr:LysR substrate-binding domain-containing protein [Actinomadura rudentiformis]
MTQSAHQPARHVGVDKRPRRPPAAHRRRHRPGRRLAERDRHGYGIALAPKSCTRFYARPGITYRPVTGVGPSQVGVAWPPAADTDPVVQDFVRCCLDVR